MLFFITKNELKFVLFLRLNRSSDSDSDPEGGELPDIPYRKEDKEQQQQKKKLKKKRSEKLAEERQQKLARKREVSHIKKKINHFSSS